MPEKIGNINIILFDLYFTEAVITQILGTVKKEECLYASFTLGCIIYNKPTRCNSGSIVFINNYKYALHVSDAFCVHHQEHYKL